MAGIFPARRVVPQRMFRLCLLIGTKAFFVFQRLSLFIPMIRQQPLEGRAGLCPPPAQISSHVTAVTERSLSNELPLLRKRDGIRLFKQPFPCVLVRRRERTSHPHPTNRCSVGKSLGAAPAPCLFMPRLPQSGRGLLNSGGLLPPKNFFHVPALSK